VGVVVVDRVDLLEVHELLDVDRAGLLRLDCLELLRRDRHVLVGADLVALDDLLVGDLVTARGVDPLLADALPGLGVDLVEPDRLARDSAVQLHRDVDQPEADRTAPYRAWHASNLPVGGLLTYLTHAFLRRYVRSEALEGRRAERSALRPLAELDVSHEARLHED